MFAYFGGITPYVAQYNRRNKHLASSTLEIPRPFLRASTTRHHELLDDFKQNQISSLL